MQPGPYGAASPPAATPTPPPSGRLTPSGWWYVVAAAFGIGGVVLAIVLGVGFAEDYADRIDDFERVQVPGSETVVLDAGDYTIYQEFFGADDSVRFPPDVTVNVTGPDGEAVDIDDYNGSFSYAGSGREGIALSTFEAEERGEYSVSTEGDTLSTIAIGEGIGMQLFVGIAAALATAFGGIVVCAVIAIVVAVKRSGAKTRRQLAMVQQGWRPPPGAPGWPGAPGGPGYGQPPYGPGYGQPPYGYQQPPPGYQPPSGGYQPPYGYQQPPSGGHQAPPTPPPASTPPAEHEGYQPSAPTRSMPPSPDDTSGDNERPSTDPPPPA